MSTIPAKETDRNHGPDGRTPVFVPPRTAPVAAKKLRQRALEGGA
jgi:hypothetical protein